MRMKSVIKLADDFLHNDTRARAFFMVDDNFAVDFFTARVGQLITQVSQWRHFFRPRGFASASSHEQIL